MHRRSAKNQAHNQHLQAQAILQQAEQLTRNGQFAPAQELFIQVWDQAQSGMPTLANHVVWELFLLQIRSGAYTDATVWLAHAHEPPLDKALWYEVQQALSRLCLVAAERTTAATNAPVLPAPSESHAASTTQEFPQLYVTNLGQLQIVRGQNTLPACRFHNAIAIFRFLLARPQHSAYKEELMDVFWPAAQPSKAAHSLHVAVNTLRRYLNPANGNYLLFEDMHYILNPAATIDDDCARFEQRCDEAEHFWRSGDHARASNAFSEAIHVYHGDYVVDSRDLPWALALRERLLARYLLSLERLGHILVTQGRLEQAVDCYLRLLERDEYREDMYYQLVHCYWCLGRRAEARQQYERCASILAQDLGLEPMPEMHTLRQVIYES